MIPRPDGNSALTKSLHRINTLKPWTKRVANPRAAPFHLGLKLHVGIMTTSTSSEMLLVAFDFQQYSRSRLVPGVFAVLGYIGLITGVLLD